MNKQEFNSIIDQITSLQIADNPIETKEYIMTYSDETLKENK